MSRFDLTRPCCISNASFTPLVMYAKFILGTEKAMVTVESVSVFFSSGT